MVILGRILDVLCIIMYTLCADSLKYFASLKRLESSLLKDSSRAAKQESVKMDKRSKVTGHGAACLPYQQIS